MTIRTKLALLIGLLLIATIGVLGYGVLFVSASLARRDAARRVDVISNSAQRFAHDSLLQKDDVLLISYMNFLRDQYPSLTGVRIAWQKDGASRTVRVGEEVVPRDRIERSIQVVHPVDAGRKVSVDLQIDRHVLEEVIVGNQRRLKKILALVSAITLTLGMAAAFWFAGTLTAPLLSLVGLATQISRGKLGGRFEWSSKDEVGELVSALNAMSQKLEELDESKRTFVSSVTHELRSPLGAIESFIHLMEQKLRGASEGDAAAAAEYLGRIKLNVQRLGGFINDLLDVAKIEKGRMECVLRPMKLQDLATDVCQFFEAKAQQQGVSVSQRLDALPEVSGDPDRLRQVLVNLLANALKFTPSGGSVTIQGSQVREGPRRWAEISVRDTGRGMDPGDAGRLFAAFSQGRNVSEGVIGTRGTGLGLYIVKSIVEQHGGKVAVDSAPGRGTEIKFTLKLAA